MNVGQQLWLCSWTVDGSPWCWIDYEPHSIGLISWIKYTKNWKVLEKFLKVCFFKKRDFILNTWLRLSSHMCVWMCTWHLYKLLNQSYGFCFISLSVSRTPTFFLVCSHICYISSCSCCNLISFCMLWTRTWLSWVFPFFASLMPSLSRCFGYVYMVALLPFFVCVQYVLYLTKLLSVSDSRFCTGKNKKEKSMGSFLKSEILCSGVYYRI